MSKFNMTPALINQRLEEEDCPVISKRNLERLRGDKKTILNKAGQLKKYRFKALILPYIDYIKTNSGKRPVYLYSDEGYTKIKGYVKGLKKRQNLKELKELYAKRYEDKRRIENASKN